MTLYTMVKTVLEAEGWKVPTSSVASSQDDNIRQAFALANRELSSVSYKKAWPILTIAHEFTTVPGQAEYPLPPDFHHLVNPSVFNASQYRRMKGSLQPLEFIYYGLNQPNPNTWYTGFRLIPRAFKFIIAPTPTVAEDVVFFYITTNLVKNSDGDPQTLYSQDSDISLVDEDLVGLGLTWRWREKKGLDYTAELAEYSGTINQRYAQIISLSDFPIGGRTYAYEDYPLTEGYLNPPIGTVGP